MLPILQGELHTKTDDGEVFTFGCEVVSAISEDAHATSAAEAGFDTATDVEVTTCGAVGAEATADEGVRGNADALDRSAEDEAAIKLMVLAVGGKEAVAALDTEVFAEEVFCENAATEGVFAAAVRKEGTTKNAESGARGEAGTTRRLRSHRSLGVLAGVGHRGACECAGGQRDGHDERSDFLHSC